MTTFDVFPLFSRQDLYPALAEIAHDAMEKDRDECIAELGRYGRRGATCMTVHDGDEMIGYVLFGPFEKFHNWTSQLQLKVDLGRRGVDQVYVAHHLYLKKAYWKTGTHLQIIREYSTRMLAAGAEWYLIWAANDEAAQYSISKPGSFPLDGFTTARGVQLGLRRIREYLAGTA